MDIESAIRVCMTCSGKLGRLEDSLAVFHEIVFLNTEQQVTIASRMAIDPVTLRGLVMACGFACKAADWLVYHDQPTTRQGFAALDSEMRQKVRSTVSYGICFSLN
jgi:hypothetical protein